MALLKAHLRKELADIMGLSPRAFGNTETGFFEMGMDSMMAVELKKRLERGLRLSFPATLAFDFPTVEVLAAHILRTAGLSPRRPARPAEGHARLDERSVAGDVQDTPHPLVESLINQELKALEELMKARLEP
jgi:acyl carrier protein